MTGTGATGRRLTCLCTCLGEEEYHLHLNNLNVSNCVISDLSTLETEHNFITSY